MFTCDSRAGVPTAPRATPLPGWNYLRWRRPKIIAAQCNLGPEAWAHSKNIHSCEIHEKIKKQNQTAKLFCHAKLCRLLRLSCNASSRSVLALLSIFHLLKRPIFYRAAIYFPSNRILLSRSAVVLILPTSTAADSYSPNTLHGLTFATFTQAVYLFFLNSHHRHQSRCRPGTFSPLETIKPVMSLSPWNVLKAKPLFKFFFLYTMLST